MRVIDVVDHVLLAVLCVVEVVDHVLLAVLCVVEVVDRVLLIVMRVAQWEASVREHCVGFVASLSTVVLSWFAMDADAL